MLILSERFPVVMAQDYELVNGEGTKGPRTDPSVLSFSCTYKFVVARREKSFRMNTDSLRGLKNKEEEEEEEEKEEE
ncbi:hypothetical protein AB9E09_35200, partial [Rhizobium leguminosarum]|uniref:hypothetical protein n=1 Tax=Rhizobium leguminosarum TaxID=384 RepID=UPI003F94EA2B